MAALTNIEWCDSTFNAWTGCQAVSPGCDHCYAAQWAKRAGRDFAVRQRTKTWGDPLRWNAKRFMQCDACGWRGECAAELIGCGACGSIDHLRDVRRRVFCNSLGDWLDNQVGIPIFVDFLDLVRLTGNLDWLLLSKRIGAFKLRMGLALSFALEKDRAELAYWIVGWLDGDHPPANVQIGATVVDQAEADRDIPKLLAVPARTRFLSMEPLLGPVDLAWIDDGAAHREVPREEWGDMDDDDSPPGLWWNVLTGKRVIKHGGADRYWSRRDAKVDQVIVGGESGHGDGIRPMHPDWVRKLRDQCVAADVPFVFKQWGEFVSGPQAIDLNDCYDKSPTGGWVELDGTFRLGEAAAPQSGGSAHVFRIGKKLAGRLLDGVEHNGFPETAPVSSSSTVHQSRRSP